MCINWIWWVVEASIRNNLVCRYVLAYCYTMLYSGLLKFTIYDSESMELLSRIGHIHPSSCVLLVQFTGAAKSLISSSASFIVSPRRTKGWAAGVSHLQWTNGLDCMYIYIYTHGIHCTPTTPWTVPKVVNWYQYLSVPMLFLVCSGLRLAPALSIVCNLFHALA